MKFCLACGEETSHPRSMTCGQQECKDMIVSLEHQNPDELRRRIAEDNAR